MSNVERLEKQIARLTPGELAELRRWFAEFDAELWDRQFEADVQAGRLDALAEKAPAPKTAEVVREISHPPLPAAHQGVRVQA